MGGQKNTNDIIIYVKEVIDYIKLNSLWNIDIGKY